MRHVESSYFRERPSFCPLHPDWQAVPNDNFPNSFFREDNPVFQNGRAFWNLFTTNDPLERLRGWLRQDSYGHSKVISSGILTIFSVVTIIRFASKVADCLFSPIVLAICIGIMMPYYFENGSNDRNAFGFRGFSFGNNSSSGTVRRYVGVWRDRVDRRNISNPPEPMHIQNQNDPILNQERDTQEVSTQSQRSGGSSVPTSDSARTTDIQSRQPLTHYINVGINREVSQECLVLALDVPGFNMNDLVISLENETVLCIKGSRVNRIGDRYVVSEYFVLDHDIYDSKNIEAELSDGVLEVRVAKKPSPKARNIPIANKKKD